MQNFETAIRDLDIRLFERIQSQSDDSDKLSLLAVQSAVRELRRPYTYLEIGSHLGGSIQPHLLDEKCDKIFSIDARPTIQPDARGFDFKYVNNSTERMICLLSEIDPVAVGKITTIDSGTGEIDPGQIDQPVHFCFIDGEHTDSAMKHDFAFCRKVVDISGSIVVFHDAPITYNGIFECVQSLRAEGIDFRAYNLPNVLFVIEFGDLLIHNHPRIMERLVNNHEGYLFSLQFNDDYRRFANRLPFRIARKAYLSLQAYIGLLKKS